MNIMCAHYTHHENITKLKPSVLQSMVRLLTHQLHVSAHQPNYHNDTLFAALYEVITCMCLSIWESFMNCAYNKQRQRPAHLIYIVSNSMQPLLPNKLKAACNYMAQWIKLYTLPLDGPPQFTGPPQSHQSLQAPPRPTGSYAPPPAPARGII